MHGRVGNVRYTASRMYGGVGFTGTRAGGKPGRLSPLGLEDGGMDTEKRRCTAVVLAAGSGRRMQSATAKQFMELAGKPLIWFSLHAVEQSGIIDDCILVTAQNDIPFVWQEIVRKYGFKKVTDVIAGGGERYASVGNAMRYIAQGRQPIPNRDGYVFIHDGARPFLSEEILRNTYEDVKRYGACVAAVPSKDTIKIGDEKGFAVSTPDRSLVWNIQTPQVFKTALITEAYAELESAERSGKGAAGAGPGREGTDSESEVRRDAGTSAGAGQGLAGRGVTVTDDASVVELFTDHKVKLTMGAYENIKITTPEDITAAEAFLSGK